ncbi:MAG: histidinol-phosphatase [Bacteroidales bacterium]|nr:histidinol-phosphatase [Bacteroidales bacterium]
MLSKTNFHTHSNYCDGKATLREMVDFAVAHNFTALGFTGHCPLPFDNTYSITDYEGYCNEVRALKEEYADRIEISLGLEMDYVPGMLEDFSPLIKQGGLEYTIGSIHLIPAEGSAPRSADDLWMIDGSRYQTYDEGLMKHFGGDIRRGVRAYFHNENAMLERNRPTIVGHPDKIVMHNRDRYFTEDEPWYRDLALETIHLIKELDLICEINTRGIYKGRHADYYPGKWLIQEMKQLHIPVLVSTDAHAPEDLLRTEGAYEYLQEIGYRDVLKSWRDAQ